MAQSLLKAVGISKTFSGVHALKDVSLEIQTGEIHCLAGENGCGKSTLIKIISGVYTMDAGYVEFNGKKYTKIAPAEMLVGGVQVIYQDFAVFPNLTVMENLAVNTELAANRKLVNWSRMRRIAEEALTKIDLKIDLDALVGSLSVAEKQMVAISRALMFNAKLIVMDEPTTALTKKEVQALFDIILRLKEQGISILFVSHKLNEVFDISDRFTILRNGELVATGNTADLDDKKFTYYMTGRKFEENRFLPGKLSKEPVLELVNLTLDGYFQNVSFRLHGGEILGITGLLDSGRTELALSLFGLRQPSGGSIKIHGKEIMIGSPRDAINSKIGYVPEDRLSEGLFLPREIGDNIIISKIDDLRNKRKIFDAKAAGEESQRWVNELGVKTPDYHNAAMTLSGGNQQKIVLAKWMACNPDILILNGPTVGVDIGSKHDIHQILKHYAGNGMAIIVVSDDLPEIVSVCSRIMIIKDGLIVAEMDGSVATEQEILEKMM